MRATFANACESVITRRTSPTVAIRSASSSGWQTRALAWASRTSRSTSCCGKMMRPFGADESMGTTSTTLSPGEIKSATTRRSCVADPPTCARTSFNSFTPAPVRALASTSARTGETGAGAASGAATTWGVGAAAPDAAPPIAPSEPAAASSPGRRSALLRTTTKGSPSSSNREISSRSAATGSRVASVTSTATSQLRKVSRVRSTRRAPNSPTSSMPGVSTMSTGPSGRSSMALRTGSVVVPATSLTSATCCPHTAFTRLDFPALRTPKKPIRTRSPEGVSFKPMSKPSFRLTVAARLPHRAKTPLEPQIALALVHDRGNRLSALAAALLVADLLQLALDERKALLGGVGLGVIGQVLRKRDERVGVAVI